LGRRNIIFAKQNIIRTPRVRFPPEPRSGGFFVFSNLFQVKISFLKKDVLLFEVD